MKKLKKVFGVFAVALLLMSMSSVNLNANEQIKSASNNIILVKKSLCAQYVDFAAAVIEEEDGTNYYQAWFASFNYCVSQIDYSLDYTITP